MPESRRIADMSPAEVGDAMRFSIRPSESMDVWEVLAYWGAEPEPTYQDPNYPESEPYDGKGVGKTLEEAMAKAIADMNGDDE